jgi:pilus assembly protein Flp/PilA
MNALARLAKNEDGATAVEYGLLAALIAAAIIAAVTLLGGNVSAIFTKVANSIK